MRLNHILYQNLYSILNYDYYIIGFKTNQFKFTYPQRKSNQQEAIFTNLILLYQTLLKKLLVFTNTNFILLQKQTYFIQQNFLPSNHHLLLLLFMN